ncbi:SDS3 deacetylase, partial [Hirundo rustica]|nr:SDS3 deacetylase [Hirundo rustica]
RMYQDKLASLKRQLQQLQEGTLQEYQKRMKKLDQQYKERIRNAGKENLDSLAALPCWKLATTATKKKSNLLCERGEIIFLVPCVGKLLLLLTPFSLVLSALQLHYSTDSMEVKPIMTRKLRRRPNDPVPIPDKRRKPAPDILSWTHCWLNYLLTDEQIMEDLRTLNKMGTCWSLTRVSPLSPASPSSPEHLPATPAESPAQRFEARIEDGKLYYDKRWYHKSQAIYLESKENTKISCVISSVGANEIWVRKTSDSTKMRIYLGQLQRGVFVIRRRSAT